MHRNTSSQPLAPGEPLDVGSSFMVQCRDYASAAVNAMANRLDDMLSREGLSPSISTRDQQIARNQSQFQILYILLASLASILPALSAARVRVAETLRYE